MLEEIAALEATRDAMRDDVDALEVHFENQRARLQSTIADLQHLVDDPARLAHDPAPLATAVAPPMPAPAPASGPAEVVVAEDLLAEEPAVEVVDEVDDEAWARFGVPGDAEDEGPRTQPMARLEPPTAAGGGGDDAYLTELRKAMIDDTGAPEGARPARFGRRR